MTSATDIKIGDRVEVCARPYSVADFNPFYDQTPYAYARGVVAERHYDDFEKHNHYVVFDDESLRPEWIAFACLTKVPRIEEFQPGDRVRVIGVAGWYRAADEQFEEFLNDGYDGAVGTVISGEGPLAKQNVHVNLGVGLGTVYVAPECLERVEKEFQVGDHVRIREDAGWYSLGGKFLDALDDFAGEVGTVEDDEGSLLGESNVLVRTEHDETVFVAPEYLEKFDGPFQVHYRVLDEVTTSDECDCDCDCGDYLFTDREVVDALVAYGRTLPDAEKFVTFLVGHQSRRQNS